MSLTTPDAQQRRTFEAEDVFFSVTDPKGVITHANQTFLRLADLTAAQAIGSPHNVIRHPQMPGGAFRLIWDELGEGRPVCLYMANEARDGLRYDVVATVAPIDGGYLSVRLRPGVPELESAVFTAYDAAAAVEADERAAGASRHEAAQEGSTALLACLGELGFSSLAEFTRHVLPREIEAFLAVVPPAAPDPAAGALGLVLASTAAIARSITPFVARLGDYEQLAQRVLAERASIAPAIAELTDLAVQISRVGELVDQNAASAHSIEMTELSELTQRMVGWLNDAIAGFEALPAKLEPLQIALRDLAMRTSMVVLLNHVLGQFTAEVIASGQERGTEVRLLHGALNHSLVQVETELESVKDLLGDIPRAVETTVRSADKVMLRVDGWNDRLIAADLGSDGAEIASLSTAVRAEFDRRMKTQYEIVGLSARLRQTPVRFETAEIREQLQHIAAGVASLA